MAEVARPQEGKVEKISFPDGKFLMMRQSLADICYGSRSAGKLLSVLLGWYTHDKKTTPEQQTFTIQLTQKKIIEDLCGELNVKTLHDTAVPVLFALEYIDIQISTYVHTYTVHLDRVRQALVLVKKPEQLEKLLITTIDQQLEKLLIVVPETIRETSNNNKKKFQLLLEKVLIVIGESSNSRRGRKPRQEATSSTQNEAPYTIETIRDSEETFLDARESDNDQAGETPSEEKKSDEFLPTGTPATLSYSQGITQTDEKENNNHSQFGGFMSGLIAETEATLTALEQQLFVVSPNPWLQENALISTADQSPSQASVVITQVAPPIAEPVPLIPPADPKPAKHNGIGNLREGLNERGNQPLTPSQQRTLDTAEKRHKEAAEKKRKEAVWTLYGKLTGLKAIRDLWSEKAVTALVEGDATDEQIDQTYTWLKSKKMSTTLSYIASNLNSCVASTKPPEKPKSELKDFTNMTDEEFEAWRRRA